MARRKNVKRIDPRYFLNETVNRNDDGSALEEKRIGSMLNPKTYEHPDPEDPNWPWKPGDSVEGNRSHPYEAEPVLGSPKRKPGESREEYEGRIRKGKHRSQYRLPDPGELDPYELEEGALNIALDVAGLIPGVGEYADVANAILYAREGKWLFAALSLISVIPVVGDAIGKGGKISIWAAKNFPKGAKTVAKYGPDVLRVVELLQKHAITVAKVFDAVAQDERVKGLLGGDKGVAEMQAALGEFSAGGTKEWPRSVAQAAEE
tara:strand:+ start:35 stop:823 length:789 start_codon:yes stop_codon:yes gene_type:complete